MNGPPPSKNYKEKLTWITAAEQVLLLSKKEMTTKEIFDEIVQLNLYPIIK